MWNDFLEIFDVDDLSVLEKEQIQEEATNDKSE